MGPGFLRKYAIPLLGVGLAFVVGIGSEFAEPRGTPNSGTWELWLMTIAVALFVALWVWNAYDEDRQQWSMAKFARVSKWSFEAETKAYQWWFREYPFAIGSQPRDFAVARGEFLGCRCASYTHEEVLSGEGDAKRTVQWQISLVELPHPLWTVDLTPEDGVAKAQKALGGQDLEFESQAFNDAWRVRAGNDKYAYDIIHPRMMERLLKPDAQGMNIRIEGRAVLSWQEGRHGPEDLARRLEVLAAVSKLIPAFVLREFEYEWNKVEEAARKREENAPDWAKTPFALSSGRYTELGKQMARDEVNKDLPPMDPRDGSDDRAW